MEPRYERVHKAGRARAWQSITFECFKELEDVAEELEESVTGSDITQTL